MIGKAKLNNYRNVFIEIIYLKNSRSWFSSTKLTGLN